MLKCDTLEQLEIVTWPRMKVLAHVRCYFDARRMYLRAAARTAGLGDNADIAAGVSGSADVGDFFAAHAVESSWQEEADMSPVASAYVSLSLCLSVSVWAPLPLSPTNSLSLSVCLCVGV